MLPEYPETVIVLLEPLKTEEFEGDAVPPTGAEVTVTPPETDVATLQSLVLVITQ